MVNTNKNWVSMNDKAIIASIGNYVKHQRLNQNITQAKVAKIAGINRWTISQIENGEAISLTSLIQILRALNLLNILDSFNINTQPSPLKLAKIEQEARKRARGIIDNPKNESQW